MKNRIIILLVALISFNVLTAQNFVGDWKGILAVQGTELEVIFHITKDGDKYNSTMDSPNQGAFGIEADETKVENDFVTITSSKLQMKMEGKLVEEGAVMEATFNQGSVSIPLKLNRMAEMKEKADVTNSTHPMAGDWNGSLDMMGTKLRLVFHVTEENGAFVSTMDSPDQGAFGLKTDETKISGNKIEIVAKAMSINVEGTYEADSNLIRASFSQAGRTMPLLLTREKMEKEELIRPQEPKTFDYKQEEVKFTNPNGGHELAGTLTIPKSGEFDKVAILVTGSGPQDRNEELLGHKPFLVISDYLTRNGVAVLRYDDRGVGASGGEFGKATSDDFALDAEAALSYLRARSDMQGKQFGVIGHSEGGMIAPIVASRTAIDYIVLLAGPGTELDFLLAEQSTAISRVSGIEEEKIEFNNQTSKVMFDYMKANKDLDKDAFIEGLTKILEREFDKLSDEEKEEMGDMTKEIESQISALSTPWFRYFLSFSPRDYLVNVKCPVLAINGEFDLQVLPKSNLKAIGEALAEGGNLNYTIRELPNLNHLFQVSENGNPNNYGKIEETFNEEALELVLTWINGL